VLFENQGYRLTFHVSLSPARHIVTGGFWLGHIEGWKGQLVLFGPGARTRSP
jgi:hypothetical protein